MTKQELNFRKELLDRIYFMASDFLRLPKYQQDAIYLARSNCLKIRNQFIKQFGNPSLEVPSCIRLKINPDIKYSSYCREDLTIEFKENQLDVLTLAHELGHHFDPKMTERIKLTHTLSQLNIPQNDWWRYGFSTAIQRNKLAEKLLNKIKTVNPKNAEINFVRGVYADFIALTTISKQSLDVETRANNEAIKLISCSAWPLETKELAIRFFKEFNLKLQCNLLYRGAGTFRDFVSRIKDAF